MSVWGPATTTAEPAPLVLVSHGTGGSAAQMAWLAEPLVVAGFDVASVDHHGNNTIDGYLPEGFAFPWERARDLRFALDWLATRRELGAVGAAGFSIGGYTAAAMLGARLDRQIVGAIVLGHIELPPLPEYPNLQADLIARVPPGRLQAAIAESDADYRDNRVGAAFLVSPAAGQIVTTASLSEIHRPVAIRWGEADDIAPPAENAERYALIPGADARSVGASVGHYEFLADNPIGGAVRRDVAEDAVRFFRTQLTEGSQ